MLCHKCAGLRFSTGSDSGGDGRGRDVHGKGSPPFPPSQGHPLRAFFHWAAHSGSHVIGGRVSLRDTASASSFRLSHLSISILKN